MKKNQILKIIYLTVLILITGFIWNEMYRAQFLDYDENWGALIQVFLISVCSFFGILFIWVNWKEFIRENKWPTLLFLIGSSPISVILVAFNYAAVFGENLKV